MADLSFDPTCPVLRCPEEMVIVVGLAPVIVLWYRLNFDLALLGAGRLEEIS